MLVSEIFKSIQGESTFAGLPCVFVRLAGCNLSCSWCDTPYARVPDEAIEMTIAEVFEEVGGFECPLVEITGGEPLLQEEALELAVELLESGHRVLIETNGSVPLSRVDPRVVKIVDVKCPSSGHAGSFLMENLEHISAEDELKFVIGSREDYDSAVRFLEEFLMGRTQKVLFAPVRTALSPAELSGWILKDGLRVRLQLQLHSYIWPGERGR
ncbi:MAG: radical SAM protein [Deltaproteobacteria bacterium]|nr:radical SAM protein [Deltaproteobacteria bacterium]